MAAPADGTLPDAGTKLRMVLDYVPCEACLAHPVDEQELLCSICARLDRQVAVRVGTRALVLVERPTPPEPVVIAPPAASEAPPEAPAEPVRREVVVRFADDTLAPPGALEVVVEPLAPLVVPTLAPAPAPVAVPEPEPEAEPEPEPEEPVFEDDVVSFVPAREEFFDFRKAPEPAAAREEAPARPVEEAPAAAAPDDDFVFRPPREEEAQPAQPSIEEEIVPAEEIPVEPAPELEEPWAPPPDFLADEAPPPEEEPPLEPEVVEMEVVAPEEVIELEAAPDEEEIVEMEIVEDEPEAPAPAAPYVATGDLDRLRGFDDASGAALQAVGVQEIAHLSGHDAGELAQRSGLPFDRVLSWVHVADLVQEVGVPVDAANALVAAGVAGPKALAEADPDEVADRVAAFGGASVAARDIKRWKRRA